MNAIMITYNQVLVRDVEEMLDRLGLRGFTRWVDVQGRGTHDGEPHFGTHTWPALNQAILVVVKPEEVGSLVAALKALDEEFEGRGVRAFGWEAESLV